MIKNKKQYDATKDFADRFFQSMEILKTQKTTMDELDFEFEYNSYYYQFNELQEELVEYENLKNKTTKVLKDKSIDDLAKILIQTRIARGWSQAKLGELLDIDQQQIQRYEASDYESASLARVLDTLDILEIKIELKDILLPIVTYKHVEKDNIIPIQRKQEEVSNSKRLFAVGE